MAEQRAEKDTTHFGYREVPIDEKADRVAEVFHSVASKYDIMNDLLFVLPSVLVVCLLHLFECGLSAAAGYYR